MALSRACFKSFALVASCVACLTGCAPDRGADKPVLTVLVAASMADVVGELAAAFEGEGAVKIEVSAAATGVLRRQVEGGAPCDVFISANAVETDRLVKSGHLRLDTLVILARNALVVVAPNGSDVASPPAPADLSGLASPGLGPVAIGDPAYVPVGRYARAALERAGVWEAMQDRLVRADNVRVAVQYVRSGQAARGIVYATDVAGAKDLRVVLTIDEVLTGPVTCPAAVAAGSAHASAAEAFLAFLASAEQDAAWTTRGFVRR